MDTGCTSLVWFECVCPKIQLLELNTQYHSIKRQGLWEKYLVYECSTFLNGISLLIKEIERRTLILLSFVSCVLRMKPQGAILEAESEIDNKFGLEPMKAGLPLYPSKNCKEQESGFPLKFLSLE